MSKSRIFIIALLAFILGVAMENIFSFSILLPRQIILPAAGLALILVFWPDKIIRLLCFWSLIFFIGIIYPLILSRATLFSFPFPALAEALKNLKEQFNGNLYRLLAEPYASFASGLVVGTDPKFPKELKEAFLVTGTIHLVAVSGYNVTIVLKIFSDFLRFFGPRLAFYLGTLSIFAFCLLVGGQPSIIRASIMGWLFLLARFLGRQPHIFNALVFTAILMILEEPAIATKNLSFQLSFLSMLGLIFLEPKLKKIKFEKGRWGKISHFIPATFKNALAATCAAQIMTLPLILHKFGRLSLVAPLTNILIIPFVPLAMGLIIAVGAVSFFSFPLGQIVGYGIWIFLKYFLLVINFFQHQKGSALFIEKWSALIMILYYLGLGAILYFLHLKQRCFQLPAHQNQ